MTAPQLLKYSDMEELLKYWQAIADEYHCSVYDIPCWYDARLDEYSVMRRNIFTVGSELKRISIQDFYEAAMKRGYTTLSSLVDCEWCV